MKMEKMRRRKKNCELRNNIILPILFIIIVITGITLFSIFFDEIKAFADDYISFLETDTVLAIFVFWVIYACSTPFWIPSTFFIIFGTYTYSQRFGLLLGFIIFTVIDFVWIMIGVVLAFLNGRYLFRKWVQRWIESKPKLKALSLALTHNAKKLVFLLRASNITPYDPLNYTWSITNMKIIDYIIGNIGVVICDAPTIYFLSSISDLSNVNNSSDALGDWYYVILSISIVITIIVVIAVFYYTRRELKKTLSQIEAKTKWSDIENKEEEKEESKKEDEESKKENVPNQTNQSSIQGRMPRSQSLKIWPTPANEVAA